MLALIKKNQRVWLVFYIKEKLHAFIQPVVVEYKTAV